MHTNFEKTEKMSLPLPSFEQLQRQLKSNSDSTSSAVSSTSSSSSSSSTSSNVDPIALLKRVEDMRKWQEEQKNMLLQAHEDNLQQFRLEQVGFTRKKNKKMGL